MNRQVAKVIVIDDEPSVRRGLSRLLRSAGYETVCYTSAVDYLEDGPAENAGCLLLDVCMPELSGIDLQERLREAQSDVPIIFLTGHGDLPTAVHAMKEGAVDFLTKPVDEEALFDAIEEAISRNRALHFVDPELAGFRERFDTLSSREREVLRYILGGALNRQIAAHLRISEKTVKAHRGKIMGKMAATSAAELGRISAELRMEPLAVKSRDP